MTRTKDHSLEGDPGEARETEKSLSSELIRNAESIPVSGTTSKGWAGFGAGILTIELGKASWIIY